MVNIRLVLILLVALAFGMTMGYLAPLQTTSSNQQLQATASTTFPSFHHKAANSNGKTNEVPATTTTASAGRPPKGSERNRRESPPTINEDQTGTTERPSQQRPSPPQHTDPSSSLAMIRECTPSGSKSGNQANAEKLQTIVKDVIAGRQSTNFQTSTFFDTEPCSALVSNFCMDNKGQPVFFHPSRLMMNSRGSTKMCNEGNTKSRMHHKVMPVNSGDSSPIGRQQAFDRIIQTSSSSLASSVIDLKTNSSSEKLTILVTPFCWELYGYHLVLCLMAMFAHLHRIGLPMMIKGDADLVFGMVKSASVFPYLAGSPNSWFDFSRASLNLPSKAQPTPFWPFWQVVADKPYHVHPISDIQSTCFDIGVFGSIPSYRVTPEEGRAFRTLTLRRLKTVVQSLKHSKNGQPIAVQDVQPDTPLVSCKQYRVVLIQRAKRYIITNLADVEAQIQQGFKDHTFSFSTLILENMTIAEQVEALSNTDVLIGVHGNGLTWSYVMPPHSALIELWPNRVYNTNFKVFATRHNLFYTTVASGANCKARCPTSYTIPPETFQSVLQHLETTACR